MTKGELMKKVYTADELKNIDAAIPKEYWDGKVKEIQVDTYYHVMNFNGAISFGRLEDMREVAKERKIDINKRVPQISGIIIPGQ